MPFTRGINILGISVVIAIILFFIILAIAGIFTKTPAPAPAPSPPTFKLTSATYGVLGTTFLVDVTNKFDTALDTNGNLTNQFWTNTGGNAYLDFFGIPDPEQGVQKTLTVIYSRNGVSNTLTFAGETTPIALP